MQPGCTSEQAECTGLQPGCIGLLPGCTGLQLHRHPPPATVQAEKMQHRFTKRMAKRRFSDSQLTAMRYNMELEQRSKPRRAALALHEPLPVSQARSRSRTRLQTARARPRLRPCPSTAR
jgi:hypothetical protein